jgi:ribosome-associated protein
MTSPALEVTEGFRIPFRELRFRTARSSGPGGQNVNRLETKVEVLFDARASRAVSGDQKERLLAGLDREGWDDGMIRVVSQRHRSQWQNKQDALEKLSVILRHALRQIRTRTATKPTRSSRMIRVDTKKRRSGVKRMRSSPLRDPE